MKLRIKGKSFARPQLIDFDSNNVTVKELKMRISEILKNSLDEDLMRSLQLSMNGKETIQCIDTDPLTSLGFVSGDVVYIILEPSLENVSHSCTPSSAASNTNQAESNLCEPFKKLSRLEPIHTKTSNEISTAGSSRQSLHIPLSDTPLDVVPESYSHLVDSSQNMFQSKVEKLGGLLHLLMIETGFLPETQETHYNPFDTLPDSWILKNDILKLNYITPSQNQCTIVITSMGPIFMIQGISIVEKISKALKTKVIPSVGGSQLRQLCLDFKNQIAFPLFIHMQKDIGSCPYHLCNLPPEISFLIMKYLDFRSLLQLSMTCHLFEHLANQPELWKRLVKRNFKKEILHSEGTETNWKKLYKDEFVLARSQEEMARTLRNRVLHPFSPLAIQPRPRVYPYGPYGGFDGDFPGIMGGPSDAYPNLSGHGPPGQDYLHPSLPSRRGDPLNPFRSSGARSNFPRSYFH